MQNPNGHLVMTGSDFDPVIHCNRCGRILWMGKSLGARIPVERIPEFQARDCEAMTGRAYLASAASGK